MMWADLWPDVLLPILGWYIAVQLCALAAAPLADIFLRGLPDRGYALAKIFGVLLVGYVLWMGTALGWLRNDTGGAWLALAIVALLSWIVSRFHLPFRQTGDWAHIGLVEGLFAVGLVVWALVRAYDPAANHTEQPMDLMFLNSIWHSPTYPPQDAWFSGYPIAYYYFGYWLLATLGRMAGTVPEITYNAGQAAWFGLLLISTYGIGYNLLAFRIDKETEKQAVEPDAQASSVVLGGARGDTRSSRLGGLVAMGGVALAGNLQGVLEWLYAIGAPVEGLARWVNVHNFPEQAAVTGQWYISTGGWWWWRTSRVIHDRSLAGAHIEVIDEFPMFSYVLGDNHPHVLAMPVVLLAIGFAMNILFWAYLRIGVLNSGEREMAPTPMGTSFDDSDEDVQEEQVEGHMRGNSIDEWISIDLPGGWAGLGFATMAVGSLLFLNTWDFPPYWGLLVLCCAAAWAVSNRFMAEGRFTALDPAESPPEGRTFLSDVATFGGLVFAGALALYVPYLFTAQSQAGGLIPNFFYPTQIQQFLVMFGSWVPALALLLWTAGRLGAPGLRRWIGAGILVVGLPVLFLIITATLAVGTEAGRTSLAETPLPDDTASYGAIMLERWLGQGFTFLFVGVALMCATALLWQWYFPARLRAEDNVGAVFQRDPAAHARMGFALLLLFCGLVLVFLPEIVYLRDQFGWRMNTIFKFYYQAWLLFGLASAYIVVEQLRNRPARSRGAGVLGAGVLGNGGAKGVAVLAGVVLAACLIFPVTAAYNKTGGFSANLLTLDATRYIETHAPGVLPAMQWIRTHVPAGATVLEAEGRSYSAEHNRVSTLTGRPTLLGWSGHQRQWRGDAYGAMAAGRPEAINTIYRSRDPAEVRRLLAQWQIDYIYVSPVERRDYEISAANEAALAAVTELVFDMDNVRIYRTASADVNNVDNIDAAARRWRAAAENP